MKDVCVSYHRQKCIIRRISFLKRFQSLKPTQFFFSIYIFLIRIIQHHRSHVEVLKHIVRPQKFNVRLKKLTLIVKRSWPKQSEYIIFFSSMKTIIMMTMYILYIPFNNEIFRLLIDCMITGSIPRHPPPLIFLCCSSYNYNYPSFFLFPPVLLLFRLLAHTHSHQYLTLNLITFFFIDLYK